MMVLIVKMAIMMVRMELMMMVTKEMTTMMAAAMRSCEKYYGSLIPILTWATTPEYNVQMSNYLKINPCFRNHIRIHYTIHYCWACLLYTSPSPRDS